MAAHRAQLDAWEAQAASDGNRSTFALDESRVLILGTDGVSAPEPVYTAEVVAEDLALDLAILRITGDEYGASLSGTDALPFVPLGDSSSVRQGDPIDLFGYPIIGGDSLTYTNGVVSGFNFEEGVDGPAWITTNATMAGGSSGGTALDRAGRLIGVPTQGTELDCRPGDTNRDGTIDAEDVGCIPLGGSIGLLRPINLAKPLILDAGWASGAEDDALVPEASATKAPAPTRRDPTPTPGTDFILDEEEANYDTPTPGLSLPYPVEIVPDGPFAAYCLTSPLYPPGTEILMPRTGVLLVPLPGFDPSSEAITPPDLNDPIGSLFQPSTRIPASTLVEITGPRIETGARDVWPIQYRLLSGAVFEGFIDERDLRPAAQVG